MAFFALFDFSSRASAVGTSGAMCMGLLKPPLEESTSLQAVKCVMISSRQAFFRPLSLNLLMRYFSVRSLS